jgi:hypothetical protein
MLTEGVAAVDAGQAGEADGTGPRPLPVEAVAEAGHERVKVGQVAADAVLLSGQDGLAAAQGDDAQQLGRSAGADGGVILEPADLL